MMTAGSGKSTEVGKTTAFLWAGMVSKPVCVTTGHGLAGEPTEQIYIGQEKTQR